MSFIFSTNFVYRYFVLEHICTSKFVMQTFTNFVFEQILHTILLYLKREGRKSWHVGPKCLLHFSRHTNTSDRISKFEDLSVQFESLGIWMAPWAKFDDCWYILLKIVTLLNNMTKKITRKFYQRKRKSATTLKHVIWAKMKSYLHSKIYVGWLCMLVGQMHILEGVRDQPVV